MKVAFSFLLVFCLCSVFAQKASTPEIIRQADLLIQDYQFDLAISVLDAAEDTLNSAVLQRSGFCYSKLGNYDDAIKSYEAIRRLDSLNRESLYSLGQLYSSREQYDLARDCFQDLIELDSTNSFYYKQYASVARKGNNVIGAISFYLKAVKLNTRDMEAYGHLAQILIEVEQYAFVDSLLTEVLSSVENNNLRLQLARAKLGQEEYDAVIRNVEQILETKDTTVTYARLMGISYFQLDQFEKVIPWMQFLLEAGAKADWIYYYLGVSYQQQGDPENAIGYLNLAIEESISDHIGTYYTQLATAYEEIKDFGNAIRTYKIAYETSKTDILLYHLARNYDIYYKDKKQAQIYYKKYLDSDDTVQLAKKWSKQRLDVLLGNQ